MGALTDYYPDWMPLSGICVCEGHDYKDGGICWRCGARLRCHICGRFDRVDTCEAHFEAYHADLIEGPE